MPGDEGLDRDVMVEVWRLASRIVANRPWLLVSWVDDTPNIPHVVVHDGPLGAALHFDDDDGPYWSGGYTRRLTWDQTSSRAEPEEWDAGWGEVVTKKSRSARADAYALISALQARWLFDDHAWDARPAPILGEGAGTIFDLLELFPTVDDAVQEYLNEISAQLERSAASGQDTYWHEPFWLVRRDGEARLLVDESGRLHLPITTEHAGTRLQTAPGMGIQEIVAHGQTATGLASNGYSIDLATAISRAGGVNELADLCDRGVAAVIFTMEHPVSAERECPESPAATDDRSHWGWEYEGCDYTLAWLGRGKDPEALVAWHAQEAVRRRRITALREFSHSDAPALDIEARAEDPEFPPQIVDRAFVSAVTRHLERLLPPVPASMAPACIEALASVGRGDADALVALPDGVTYADQAGSPIAATAPAREVVRQHSLSNFVRPAEEAERVWDLARALDAWTQAERGEWEIPSPAPTWPEYVTLLLVGRNHLVPGAEDDPSERETIRSWWIDEAGDWDREHDESWWSIETTEVMNLPDPEAVARGDMTLSSQGVDPLERRWIELMADLVAAGRGRSAEARWSEPIQKVLTVVRSAGSFGPRDLSVLEDAFVAASRGLFTTVIATDVVDADFADFADAVSSSIESVGMGFGWRLPETLHVVDVDYCSFDVSAGYADLIVCYVDPASQHPHGADGGGEARLELFRAGSGVLMMVTEEVPADQAAASNVSGARWLPRTSRSSMRYERWAESLSGMRQWYVQMATALRGPGEPEHRSEGYLAPIRRDVDRALGYARAGRFADAEIVLEATFDGWTEVTPALMEAKLMAEAELAQLMGRKRDAAEFYRELVRVLGASVDPARLIEVTRRALATASDAQERSAWVGFALRVIAFTRSWHPEAPVWQREIERLSNPGIDPARDVTPPVWLESSLTPQWDGTIGAPALVVIVGAQLSRGLSTPSRAHSAVARLERALGDDIILLSGGNDDLLRLAGSRRLVQLGRSCSPRQLDHAAADVRHALATCGRVVLIGADDIDGWRAAQLVLAPKAQLQVIQGSTAPELESAVIAWAADELSDIAYAAAIRAEDESR